jgi:hypothetical protein
VFQSYVESMTASGCTRNATLWVMGRNDLQTLLKLISEAHTILATTERS